MLNSSFAAAIAAALFVATPALAADEPVRADEGKKVVAAKTMRASKLSGLEVRNHSGDQLGSVNDLVINLENGKIAYVALSRGGVLGVGDKLFAVPFEHVQFKHGRDEQFFVLDIAPEKLEAAPGFDQDKWPDFADPNFHKQMDEYYQKNRVQADESASATRRDR